jgi:hypothetical protein
MQILKLTSEAFSFSVVESDEGIHTTLTQTKTGKTKEFFQASGSVVGVSAHMASLTDEQCKGWLK